MVMTEVQTTKERVEKRLSAAIENPHDQDEFFKLLAVCCVLMNIGEFELSSALNTPRQIVSRWLSSKTCPTPVARVPVYRFLLRRLRETW